MPTPLNQATTSVQEEVYMTLKKIKEKQGCTFNDVIEQLCEMEFKNNYTIRTEEFELIYRGRIYPFTATFKKNNFTVKYFKEDSYTTNIKEWGLDEKVVSEFYEFLHDDCARCMLSNMPFGLMFDEFDIYKKRMTYKDR